MHDTVTPQLLRDAVLGVNTAKAKMIIEIWEDHIDGLRKLIGKESTYATCQKYNAEGRSAQDRASEFQRLNYLLEYRTNLAPAATTQTFNTSELELEALALEIELELINF